MTKPKANARPKKLSGIVKAHIAARAISSRDEDRTLLAKQVIEEIEAMGEAPPTVETAVKYISQFRSREVEEKPWSTADLNNAPVPPEALFWLMRMQRRRLDFCSKALSVREAKWFSRLFGFRNELLARCPASELGPAGKREWAAQVIATMAYLYARTERIDFIVRNQSADYSELDRFVTDFNLGGAMESYSRAFVKSLGQSARDQRLRPGIVENFDPHWFQPFVVDGIYSDEYELLGHGLGDPDMEDFSKLVYSISLHATRELRDKHSANLAIVHMSYTARLSTLLKTRRWAKDYSGEWRDIEVRLRRQEDTVEDMVMIEKKASKVVEAIVAAESRGVTKT